MLAILDYKAGNQTSVLRALRSLGIEASITADPSVILGAEGVIFPGVGAAGQAMAQLRSSGMDAILRRMKGQPTSVDDVHKKPTAKKKKSRDTLSRYYDEW